MLNIVTNVSIQGLTIQFRIVLYCWLFALIYYMCHRYFTFEFQGSTTINSRVSD